MSFHDGAQIEKAERGADGRGPYADHHPQPVQGEPIDGEVICPSTRAELQKLFERSDCGKNTALFETYFVKGSHPPRCLVCGKMIPFHAVDAGDSPSTAATAFFRHSRRRRTRKGSSELGRDRQEEEAPTEMEEPEGKCPIPRRELRRIFKESQGGKSNPALFEASFVKGSYPPRCIACGELLHVHLSRASVSTDGPSKTIRELQDEALEAKRNRIIYPAPPHWRDSAFRLLSFYHFKGVDHQSDDSEIVWRCVATDGTDATPCQHAVAAGQLPVWGRGGISLKEDDVLALKSHLLEVHHIDVDSAFTQTKPEPEGLNSRLLEVHHIDVDASFTQTKPEPEGPGQWSTGLLGCAGHPRSCIDCILCYPFGISWWFPDSDLAECMSHRLNQLTNHESKNESAICRFCQPFSREPALVVRGYNPALGECTCNGVLFVFLIVSKGAGALWVITSLFVGVTQLLTSIFTLCGLPCRDMPPALLNDCYQHRRYIVEQQGIPESHLQSKLITLFCWPCSECQVWRELQANGIWPGLCMCSGSDFDKAEMEPPNVRLRLDNRLVAPTGPSPMGSPWTASICS